MSGRYKIAVVGATGNVGREILSTLAQRVFPAKEIVALASRESAGKAISYGEHDTLYALPVDQYNFKGTDYAIFTAGDNISKKYAPIATKAGCVVIDNSSQFRMDKNVPLVIPEINIEDTDKKPKIIASPNCCAIPLCMVLKPLHDYAGIKRVVVSTYQSVSGAGKEAMDELYAQTKGIYIYSDPEPKVFQKQIAFNVLPMIGEMTSNDNSFEEEKIIEETKKIVDPSIEISVTSVRVPVFVGHCLSVNIEFESEISVENALEELSSFEGVLVVDSKYEGGFMTPIECVQEDEVFVSRIRKDTSVKHGINLWIVCDNIKKGAALNAIQILEHITGSHFIVPS